jgi:hypothetical protein
MRNKIILAIAVASGLAVTQAGAATARNGADDNGRTVAAGVRHFDGRVASVDRDARTFRLRTESGSLKRISVTSSTRFERLAGFAGLRRGLNVEVDASRSDGSWVATQVERHRNRADRNRNDDRGGDDHRGRGRGSDDAAGDDHGGHGNDDGPNHS